MFDGGVCIAAPITMPRRSVVARYGGMPSPGGLATNVGAIPSRRWCFIGEQKRSGAVQKRTGRREEADLHCSAAGSRVEVGDRDRLDRLGEIEAKDPAIEEELGFKRPLDVL